MKVKKKPGKNKVNNYEQAMPDIKEHKSTPTGIAAHLIGDSAIESLIGEVIALFHRLRFASEEIHRQGELTSGKLGVLAELKRYGPQTVPQMARARPVSRQYIQTLVNMLAEEGLLEFMYNPAHKRSHLAYLTKKGELLADEAHKRQKEIISRLKIDISEKELWESSNVLKTLRKFLESKTWTDLLKTTKRK